MNRTFEAGPPKQTGKTYQALYQGMVLNWPEKARAMRARRWRIIRQRAEKLEPTT